MSLDIVGYCAICTGALSLTPQIVQMIITKSVRDINIYFLLISVASDVLYLVYSVMAKNNFMLYSMFPPVLSHIIMLILWVLYNKTTDNTIDNAIDNAIANTIANTI
jgi:uncharacterized protein with PQ loop repeat